jgi:thioredoxin-like negative regulator of GroEL
VEKVPFLVERLKIQVLPCVILFKDGIAVDRVVGFEELGNTDNFTTRTLERRIAREGVITLINEDGSTGLETKSTKKTIYGGRSDNEDDDSDWD